MIKGWEENLVENGYVYGLDGGDGFMGVYLVPNPLSYTY